MAHLVNFRRADDFYHFRIRSENGREDFFAAIDALKREIPAKDRWFDVPTKIWQVLITPENEEALKEIFENGEQAIYDLKAQLLLPM